MYIVHIHTHPCKHYLKSNIHKFHFMFYEFDMKMTNTRVHKIQQKYNQMKSIFFPDLFSIALFFVL